MKTSLKLFVLFAGIFSAWLAYCNPSSPANLDAQIDVSFEKTPSWSKLAENRLNDEMKHPTSQLKDIYQDQLNTIDAVTQKRLNPQLIKSLGSANYKKFMYLVQSKYISKGKKDLAHLTEHALRKCIEINKSQDECEDLITNYYLPAKKAELSSIQKYLANNFADNNAKISHNTKEHFVFVTPY